MLTIAGGFSHLSTMFSNRCTITTSLFQRAFSWDRDAKKELPTTLPRTPYKVTSKNTNKKKIHVFGFILTIWIDVVYQIIVPFRCHFITMTSLKIPIINGKTLCYNYGLLIYCFIHTCWKFYTRISQQFPRDRLLCKFQTSC